MFSSRRNNILILILLARYFCNNNKVYGVSVKPYNGTTTLDEQASFSVESLDRTAVNKVRFPYRPNVIFDSVPTGSGALGVYTKPPPLYHRPRPPHHHHQYHHHSPASFIAPPHPPKYYPVESFYPDDYEDPDCSFLAPLLALKTSLAAVFKLTLAKLPALALKLFVKAIALLVVLGPLLLPLLLLFPVPVFGFNAFGTAIAVTGFANNGNGNFINNNIGGNRVQSFNGRQAALLARLPPVARGPCLPRLACEMGYWGFREQVAWILDHATETMKPTFPQMFNAWKRAYTSGGKGRDCGALYFCPIIDKILTVASQQKLIPD